MAKKPLSLDEFLSNVDWDEGYADPDLLSESPIEVPAEDPPEPQGYHLLDELPPETLPEEAPAEVPEPVVEEPPSRKISLGKSDLFTPFGTHEFGKDAKDPTVYRGKMGTPEAREEAAQRAEAQRARDPRGTIPGFEAPTLREKLDTGPIAPPEGHPLAEKYRVFESGKGLPVEDDPRYSGKHGKPEEGGPLGKRPSYLLKQKREPYEASPTNPPPRLYHEGEAGVIEGTWSKHSEMGLDRYSIAGRGDRGVIHSAKTWPSTEDPNITIQGVYSNAHHGYIHKEDYRDYQDWVKSYGNEPAGKDLLEVYLTDMAYAHESDEFKEKYKESIEELEDVREVRRWVNALWDGSAVKETVVVRDPSTGEPISEKVFGNKPPSGLDYNYITAEQMEQASRMYDRMENDPNAFLVQSGRGLEEAGAPTRVQEEAIAREKKRASYLMQMVSLNASGEDVSLSEVLASNITELIFAEVDRDLRGGALHEWGISRLLGDYGPGSHADVDKWFEEAEGSMHPRKLLTESVNLLDEGFPVYVELDNKSKARMWATAMLGPPLMRGDISQEQVDLIHQEIDRYGEVLEEQYNPLAVELPGYQSLGRDSSVGFLEDPLGHALGAVSFALTVMPSLGWSATVAAVQALKGSSGAVGEPNDQTWRGERTRYTLKELTPKYLKIRPGGELVPAPEEMDRYFSQNPLTKENIEEGVGPAFSFLRSIAKIGVRGKLEPGDVAFLMTAESRNAASEALRERLSGQELDDKELQQALFYNRDFAFMRELDYEHRDLLDDDSPLIVPPGGFTRELAYTIWERTRPHQTESGHEMKALYPWPPEYGDRSDFKGAQGFADYLSKKRAEEVFATGQFGAAFKENPKLASDILHMFAAESRPDFDGPLANWTYHTSNHLTAGLALELAASLSFGIDWLSPNSEWMADGVYKVLASGIPHMEHFGSLKEFTQWKVKHQPGMVLLDVGIFGGWVAGKTIKSGAKRLSKRNLEILKEKRNVVESLFNELGDNPSKERAVEISSLIEETTADIVKVLESSAVDKVIVETLKKRTEQENVRAQEQRGDAAVLKEVAKVDENPSAVNPEVTDITAKAGDLNNAHAYSSVFNELVDLVELFGEDTAGWPVELRDAYGKMLDTDALLADLKENISVHASKNKEEWAAIQAEGSTYMANKEWTELQSHYTRLEKELLEQKYEFSDLTQEIVMDERARLGDVHPSHGEVSGFIDPVGKTSELTSAGLRDHLSRLGEWYVETDPKTGEFYVAATDSSGIKVLDFLIENVADPAFKAMAEKIRPDIEGSSTKVIVDGMKVEHEGKQVRAQGDGDVIGHAKDAGARGVVWVDEKSGVANLHLRGANRRQTGLNAVTILHEFLHVATSRRIEAGYSLRRGIEKGKLKEKSLTPGQRTVVKASRELDYLHEAVVGELVSVWDNLSPSDRKAVNESGTDVVITDPRTGKEIPFNRHWIDAVENTHELVSWGLTSPGFQRFIEGTNLGVSQPKKLSSSARTAVSAAAKKYLMSVSGSVYSQFAKLIRRLTGLEEVSNSAFMGVLEATEGLLGSGVSLKESLGISQLFPGKSFGMMESVPKKAGSHPQAAIKGSPATKKAIQEGIEYPTKSGGERSLDPLTPREALAGERSVQAAAKNVVDSLGGAITPKGDPYVLGTVAKTRQSFVDSLRAFFADGNPLLAEFMVKGDAIFNEMSIVAEKTGPVARAKRTEINSSVKRLQKEVDTASKNITDAVWDAVNRLDEVKKKGDKARKQAAKIQDKIDATPVATKRRKLEIARDRLLQRAEEIWPAAKESGYETKDLSLKDRVRLSNSTEAQIVRIEADIKRLESNLVEAVKSKDKAKAEEIKAEIDNYNAILELSQVLQTRGLPGAWKVGKKDVYTKRDAHSLRERELVVMEVADTLKTHYEKIKKAGGGKVHWPDQGALSKLYKRGGQSLLRNEQVIANLKGYEGRGARAKYSSDVSIKARAENLVDAGVTDPFVYAQLFKTTLSQWKSRRKVGEHVARAREVAFTKGTDKAMGAIAELADAKGQTVREFLSEQGRMNVAYQLAEKGVKDPAVYAVLRLPDRLIGRFVKQAEGKISKPFVLDRPSDHIRNLFVREVKAITEPYKDRKYSASTSALEFFGRRFFGDWTIDAASGKTTYNLIPSAQKIYAIGEFFHRPTAWIDMPGHIRDSFIFMNARNGGKSADAAINALSWFFVNNSGKLGPDFYGAERRLTGQQEVGKDIARILTRPFLGKDATWKNIKHIERVLESVELANEKSVGGYMNQLKSGYAFFARKSEANMASMLAHGAMKLKFDWTNKEGVTKTYTMDFAELQFKVGDKWYNREKLQELVESKKISRDVAYGQTTNIRFKPTKSWGKLDGAQKTILLFLNEHLVPIEKRLWEMQMQMHLAKDRLRLSIVDPLLTEVVDSSGNTLMTFPNTKKGERQAFELAENTEGTTVRRHHGGQRVFGKHLRNDYLGDGIIKSSTWISEFFDGRFAMDLLWDLFELARDENMSPAEFEGMLHTLDVRYGKTLPRTKSLESKQRSLRSRSVRASKKGRTKEAELLWEEAESLGTASGMIKYYKASKDSPFKVNDIALDPYIERFERMRRWGDLPFNEKLRHGLFDFREGASRTMAGLSHNVALSGFLVWMRENGILKTATELEAEGFLSLEEGFSFSKKDKGLNYTKLADDVIEWGNIPKGFHIESRASKAIKEWNAIGKVSDGIVKKTWQYARDSWKLFQVANFVGGTMARAIIGNATQLGVMAPIMWSPKYALEYTKDVKTFRRTGKASDLYMEIRKEGHGGVTFASEIVTPEAYLDWQLQAMNPKHEFWSQIGKFGDDTQKRVSTLIDFFSQDFSRKSSDGLVKATALDQMKQPLRKTATGRQAKGPSKLSPRGVMGAAKKGAQEFYGFHRGAFASIDDGFKGSYIYQLVKDHGWSIREAIRMADKVFMDYRDIAPALNTIRSSPWAIGEPFITFMIKWQFLAAEFMAQNPVKSWAMTSLNKALLDSNLAQIGWTQEDLKLYTETEGEPGLFPGPAMSIERPTGRLAEDTDYPLTGPIALERQLLGDPVNPLLPPMFSERKRLDQKKYREQTPYPMGTNFKEDLKSAAMTAFPEGGFAPAVQEFFGMAPRYNPNDPWGKMMNELSFGDGLGHVVNTAAKGLFANYRGVVRAYSAYKGREVMGEDVSDIRATTSFWGLTAKVLDWRKPYRTYSRQEQAAIEPLAAELSALIKDSFSGKRLAEVRQDGTDPLDFMMGELQKAMVLSLRIQKVKMAHLPKKLALFGKVMAEHENVMASYKKFIVEEKLYPLHEIMVDKGLLPRDFDLHEGVKGAPGIEVKIIERDDGVKEVFTRYSEGSKLTDREKALSDRSPGRLHEAFIEQLIIDGLATEEEMNAPIPKF